MDTKVFEVQAQSVKELKKQISDLRDEIVRLKTSGQDYSQQVQQLQATQRVLNEVMGASKKESTALEGSYNALAQKMKELKEEYHSTSDAMRRAELAPQIRSIRDVLASMDAAVGTYTRNVGNYASAFSQVKQVGGDLTMGFQALSGVLGLTATQEEKASDAMARFATVMAVAQGARGIVGMVDSLKKFTTATKAATVAQEALNQATGQGAVATAAAGKETQKLGANIAKLVKGNPEILAILVALAAAIGAVVYWWDEVSAAISRWMGWEKKSKEETEKLAKANENLNDKFEEQNHTLDNTSKIMKAQGKSEREILGLKKQLIVAQREETQATLDTVKARIAEIQAHSWLQRLINGENKERKKLEEQVTELEKSLKKLDQTKVDIEVDIQVAEINDRNTAANKAKEQLAELKKAAEDANKEVAKILAGEDDEVTKILKKYQALGEALLKNEKAEKDFAKAQKASKEVFDEIYDRYLSATNILTKQRTDELNKYFASVVKKAYDAEKQIRDLEKKSGTKGWGEMLFGKADKLAGDMWSKVRGLKKELKETSQEITNDVDGILESLNGRVATDGKEPLLSKFYDNVVNRGKEFYKEMLRDEDKFLKDWGEPFATALKEIGPLLFKVDNLGPEYASKFIDTYIEALDKAVSEKDPTAFESARMEFWDMFFDNDWENLPGGEEVKAGMQKYIAQLRKEMSEEIIKDDKKTYGQKLSALQVLFGEDNLGFSNAKKALIRKNLIEYKDITVSTLNEVYQAWGNVINAMQASIQKQKEEGKISEKEAKRREDNLKRSFKWMQGFQIATAGINGAAAVLQAMTDPEVPNFYVRLANSIAAAAVATAQIAQIKSQQFNSSSAGVSAPQLVDRTPYTSTVGLNPQDYADAQAQNPIRAYVVDKDLKRGMQNYDNKQEETSF